MGPGGQLNKHILSSNGCLPIIYDTIMYDISTLGTLFFTHATV